jgi:hypothetical protein
VIRRALTELWLADPGSVLVTGGCPQGADALCEQCWIRWGGQLERHPAQWQRHGRGAGYRRNNTMVALGADLCVAFIQDNSPGASHAVHLWPARLASPTTTVPCTPPLRPQSR